MVTYYKKHIFNLVKLLQSLDADSDDFDTLIGIQLYLINLILKTQEKIKQCRYEVKEHKACLRKLRLSKNDAKQIKDRIENLKTRTTKYKWLLYIWRSFGDGIAFKYLNKWDIKPLMYQHHKKELKQPAGELGKEGMNQELSLVLKAKENGVPALMTDLTNVIRHGDVCLLGASEPCVIEVKSSSNKNRRVIGN